MRQKINKKCEFVFEKLDLAMSDLTLIAIQLLTVTISNEVFSGTI